MPSSPTLYQRLRQFPARQGLRWAVLAFLVTPALLYVGLGRNQLVDASILSVVPDSSGDLVVEVRLENISRQPVSFPGQSTDFLFYEVIAPGLKRRGLAAWRGTEGLNHYTTLEAGGVMKARALISSRHRDTPLQVAFFREDEPSNLAQTASAVSDQVPLGQEFRNWLHRWSQQRSMVYSPKFIPGEAAR